MNFPSSDCFTSVIQQRCVIEAAEKQSYFLTWCLSYSVNRLYVYIKLKTNPSKVHFSLFSLPFSEEAYGQLLSSK